MEPPVFVPIWVSDKDSEALATWLQGVDLIAVPAPHQAVRQALTDLDGGLEHWTQGVPGDLWLEDAVVLLD